MALNLLELKFFDAKSALDSLMNLLKKQLLSIYSKILLKDHVSYIPVSVSIILAWSIDTHYKLYRISGIDIFGIISPNTS